jgi:HK97 family phage major capsid protein
MSPNSLRGLSGTRYLIALGAARGSVPEAGVHAAGRGWFRDTPLVERALNAAMDPTGTDEAAGLIAEVGRDLALLAAPSSIIGRLTGFRRVPLGVRMLTETAAAAASWVGQGKAKPLTRADFAGSSLGYSKIVSHCVVSEELLLTSSPQADVVLSQILVAAIASALDSSFIDPSSIAILGARPASVTSGGTEIPSTGSSLAQIDQDLGDAINALSDGGSNLANATWVLHPRSAVYLSRLRGTSGAPAYPQMGAKGGTLLGLPAITSGNVLIAGGSGSSGEETIIALLDPAEVRLADDSAAELGVARNASLQLEDAPGSGAQETVSLWQLNLAALRVERWINWKAARPAAAASFVSGVAY